MFCFHISQECKWRPIYFAVDDCGMTEFFMRTARHCSFFSVKVTCTDLVAIMWIYHFIAKFVVGRDGLVGFAMQLLDQNAGQE
jgi:hypothetical protein